MDNADKSILFPHPHRISRHLRGFCRLHELQKVAQILMQDDGEADKSASHSVRFMDLFLSDMNTTTKTSQKFMII